MNDDLQYRYSKIINILKIKRELSSKDIAKHLGEEWHNGKFKALLNYLEECDYIKNTKSYNYTITPKGDEFESFDKKEQDGIEKNKLKEKINELTIENLQLQNKNLKRYTMYLIASFVAGAITTNLKDILILLKILPQ